MADPIRLSASDRAALRDIIRTGSHSFYAASRLLPANVRHSAFALYAFCRTSDDIIDLDQAGHKGVAALRRRLSQVYAGRPDDSLVDRAFCETVQTHAIPHAIPAALLEGLSWDTHGRRFDRIEDVHAYAARVAGTVGAMMTIVMGVRDSQALARATDLGAAMQLTNIARDVGEDARSGRVYLPCAWLEADGLDIEAWLAAPEPVDAVRSATERLLDEAARLYARGLTGVALLPAGCRPAICAAAMIYAEIGCEVAKNGYDSVTRRAVVPHRRKLALLAKSLTSAFGYREALGAAALPANQFLIDAVSPLVPQMPKSLDELGPVATMLELCLRVRDRTDLVSQSTRASS